MAEWELQPERAEPHRPFVLVAKDPGRASPASAAPASAAPASAAPASAAPASAAPASAAPASSAAGSRLVSPVSLDVPERPALAPDIELVGEAQGSGFQARQWLVERGGHFIQLTELLYRVAAQLDGQRTLEQIAARVAQETGRPVSANNVRYLLAQRLMPAGIVADAAADAAGARRDEIRSPLTINLRTRVLGPRVIEPITGILQYLYLPPVLIVVLLLTVVSQVWAFALHGLGGALHQVVLRPELLLVLAALSLLVGPIHEFGHAAALRYGGGKVRWMGVGLYIIYPAFYTDVTDSYRLSRWGRVRTDLGGFYFSLIMSLGITALYFVTGQEYLLLFPFFLDFEILDEFSPFVRFDGYWVLADLTGLPDFFTLVGPFIRSMLRRRWTRGAQLPSLKRWVRVVFAIYIVITLPLVGLMFVLLLVFTPVVLALTWQSFSIQLAQWPAAQSGGDVAGMAVIVLRAIILAMPALGTLLMLYLLGRSIFRLLLRMGSRASAPRRAVAFAGALALVAALALAWAVQLQAFAHLDLAPATLAAPAAPAAASARTQPHADSPVSVGTLQQAQQTRQARSAFMQSAPITITCASARFAPAAKLCVHTRPGAALTITITYCGTGGPRDLNPRPRGTVYADAAGNYVWMWRAYVRCRAPTTADITVSWRGHTTSDTYTFGARATP